MSVTLYDTALLKKLQFWVKDPNITILGVDESSALFMYRADINNDKPLPLPLISLSREPTIIIRSTTKNPLTYDGLKVRGDKDTTSQLNSIPITINYQLDVYTRYDSEAQEYMRNFIFNFINYPKIAFEIPYNDSKLIMNAFIKLDSEYVNNSDIPERLFRDQFNRQTLKFSIDGYLYDYKTTENWKIDCSSLVLLLLPDEIIESDGSIDINN